MKKYYFIIFILVLAIVAETGYIFYLRKNYTPSQPTNTTLEENIVSNTTNTDEGNTLISVDTNKVDEEEIIENTSELENLLTYSNTVVKEPETYEEVIFPTAYSLDKVLVYIKNNAATKAGLTLVIKDLNMEKPVFTENYKLLYQAGSVWADYPLLDSSYKFSQDLMFGEDYVFEQNIEWRDLYGELKPGIYKLEKTQKINGKYLNFTSPTFEIK